MTKPSRPSETRIPPVERPWTAAQSDYLEPHELAGRLINVFKTAAHHPELARSFDAFAFGYINSESLTLSPRHRELAILRIGWLCDSEYEWAAHSRVALSVGITEEEQICITRGPDAEGWTPFEATLLRAVDELHRDAFITDVTWNVLAEGYDTQQLMDLVFTVGTYSTVSMFLNSFGVQLDEGFRGFPEGAMRRDEASGILQPSGSPLEQPVRIDAGESCIVDLKQAYTISGTVSGSLDIDYRILVLGPCGSPLGTFDEEWIAHGTFTGTVGGSATQASLSYTAKVKAGGDVEGRIVFGQGLDGELRVHGNFSEGRLSYDGWVE